MPKSHEKAGFARAEAEFFGLSCRCLQRPDETLAALLKEGGVSIRLRELLSCETGDRAFDPVGAIEAFEAECAKMPVDGIRLRLEVDYNRLFVGPGALLAPPYESYYASEARQAGGGRLRTEDERAVAAAYRKSGFAVPEPLVELPDHIAIELEFLARLAGAEADFWERGSEEEALESQSAQARFIEEHLGTWAKAFAERVGAGSRTVFYPAIANLAAAYCS